MSIPMDAMCFQCHLRRNLDTARRHGDETKATAFAKELMQLYLRMPEGSSSPELGPCVRKKKIPTLLCCSAWIRFKRW